MVKVLNLAGLRKRSGSIAVVGISLVCFAVTMGVWTTLQPMEEMSVDFRMRWRLALIPEEKRTDTTDVVLLAIDQKSEDALGRFGAGRWLSRGPFLDQLRFLRAYFRPTVLAYDIIFKDTQGYLIQDGERISEVPARTGRISDAIAELATETVDCVSDTILSDLSQLALEQGNIVLTHGFASVWEDTRFAPVLGFNFRGGWSDVQSVPIPPWVDGNGAGARGVAYLRDIAIPEGCIHFSSPEARSRYRPSQNANLPSSDLWDYSYLGALNIPRDLDGVVRRVPLVMGFLHQNTPEDESQLVFVPSFALLSVLLHLGADTFPLKPNVVDVFFGKEILVRTGDEVYRIPIDALGRMRLNYRWQQKDFSEVSFAQLAPSEQTTTVESRLTKAKKWVGLLRDRIAVVGVTATGVDVGATPIKPNTPLVYVQLTAINNILTRSFLRPITSAVVWALMAFLLIGFILLCLAVRGERVVLAVFIYLLVYCMLAYVGVHVGIIALPVVGPILFVVLSTFWVLSFRYFTESRARHRIRNMFSSMVSGKVLSFLEDNPESFSLEGHAADASILFTDVEEFTTLSEHLPPAKIIQLMNMYLTPVTDSVLQGGGYLDKYVGDEVMAVWGAPYSDSDHALRACRSALEQQRIITGLNEAIQETYGFRLRVRMGINSGEVTAGNMGSELKFQYTVLGDPVNLASRLEPVNRDFGTDILIGEATQRMIDAQLETREICRLLVSGRHQAVTVYELLGERGQLDTTTQAVTVQYALALRDFYAREWSRCIATLEAVLDAADDGPSKFLIAWSRRCQQNPPASDWQGVYVRVGKG